MSTEEGAKLILSCLYVFLYGLGLIALSLVLLFLAQSRERSKELFFRPKKRKKLAVSEEVKDQIRLGMGNEESPKKPADEKKVDRYLERRIREMEKEF